MELNTLKTKKNRVKKEVAMAIVMGVDGKGNNIEISFILCLTISMFGKKKKISKAELITSLESQLEEANLENQILSKENDKVIRERDELAQKMLRYGNFDAEILKFNRKEIQQRKKMEELEASRKELENKKASFDNKNVKIIKLLDNIKDLERERDELEEAKLGIEMQIEKHQRNINLTQITLQEVKDEVKVYQEQIERMKKVQNFPVKLNVGGKRFHTSGDTLKILPYFQLLLSTENKIPPTKDGYYLIDRDPTYFPLILQFCYQGEIELQDLRMRDSLIREFSFYGIKEESLVDKIYTNNVQFQIQISPSVEKHLSLNYQMVIDFFPRFKFAIRGYFKTGIPILGDENLLVLIYLLQYLSPSCRKMDYSGRNYYAMTDKDHAKICGCSQEMDDDEEYFLWKPELNLPVLHTTQKKDLISLLNFHRLEKPIIQKIIHHYYPEEYQCAKGK